MISITTILSFAVVLLAASSYSAPIDIQPDSSNSKVNVKYPNEQPVVTESVYNNESTSVSYDRKDRSSEEKDSDEKTTEGFTRPPRGFQMQESAEYTTEIIPRQSRTSEDKDSDEMTTESFTRPSRGFNSKESDEMTTEVFTRPTRGFDSKESDEMTTEAFTRPSREVEGKDSDEMTTEVYTQSPRSLTEDTFPSSTEENKKRTVEEFLYTTLESSTQFNQRAIRPVESQEYMEASSPFPSYQKKNIDEEPTSSFRTFGKSTGLLQDEPNYESNKEIKKKSQFPDTVTVIPDKSSEAMMYTESPSKKSVLVAPVEQKQLSQVQYQPNVEKTKSNN